jgi:hypothetical protein
VKFPTVYPGAKLLVLAAPSVQVSADGLEPGGLEQGMNIYGRDSLPAEADFAVNVSGTAPPPNARGDAESGSQSQDQQGGPVAGKVTVEQIPGRLDVLKWPLIAGFLGLFALGAILLVRKPVVAVAGGSSYEGAHEPVIKSRVGSASKPVAAASTAPSLADVDAAVGVSLDSLKDQMFRLELRRQAGTISEEEYTQERARTEKVLRDLVRG